MKLLLSAFVLIGLFPIAGCSQFGDDNNASTPPTPPSAMGTMPNPPSFTPDTDSSVTHRQPVPGEDPGDF